jgi:rhodanese-related sulfurtransferase
LKKVNVLLTGIAESFMKNINIIILISVLVIFSFYGCLKDLVTEPVIVSLDTNAKVLDTLESRNNFINTGTFPSLVNAVEVYNNLSHYLIIDVRSHNDFINGHIQNAVNIKPDSLLLFMKLNEQAGFLKITIVSSTGQAASYFAGLLILDGYPNVYAMKFGMASWNSVFASPWLNAVNDYYADTLNKIQYPPAELSPLPPINSSNNNSTIKSMIDERIESLFEEGFDDDFKSSYSTPVSDFNEVAQIIGPDVYLVCLGDIYFYGQPGIGLLHPRLAVDYPYMKPFSYFASANYLQTLPDNKPIYLYSYSGHISAFITAYLRILGYDANSILYGGNNIIHGAMVNSAQIYPYQYNDYIFTSNEINNFPYVTGNLK